jgi:conjugal transfer pilus assembly protein TraB
MIDIKKFDRKKLFKSRAVVVGGIIVITILSSIGVYSGIKAKSVKQEEVKSKATGVDIKIRPTKEVVSTETLWRDAILAKINDLDRKQGESLSKESLQLKLSIEEVKEKQKEQQKSDGDFALANKVSNLARELTELKSKNNLMIKEGVASKSNDISQYNLNLENAQNSEEYKPLKTTDNYIPAGSFAKAVLLSGVDAATSLDASGNPDPILIRIIDHGTLPRKFKSDLKDCHVIGAVYGDLSSERAKVRIEKLSCTEIATAEIIETEVVGFVSGEDGRAGIRGEVVSTEGKLLGNSFAAGMLGGFANSFNPNTGGQQPSIILSDKPQKQSVRNKLGDGFATGATSSMDRLAKYYIDRAENLQPIVQVGAGRKVDIIFTEGVFFGNSEIKKAISKKRDERIRNELGSASSGAVDSSVIQPLN